MHMRIAGAALGFVAGLMILVGCNSDGMAEVSGSVIVDEQPVNGSIAFIPADGKAQTAGGPIENGRYAFRAPVGTAKVEIRVPKEVGRKKLYNTPNSPEQPILEEVLPKKYNNETELRYDVQPGKNEKDWNIRTKP